MGLLSNPAQIISTQIIDPRNVGIITRLGKRVVLPTPYRRPPSDAPLPTVRTALEARCQVHAVCRTCDPSTSAGCSLTDLATCRSAAV
jgi:hypothetical protein